jgi:hypothetical protein
MKDKRVASIHHIFRNLVEPFRIGASCTFHNASFYINKVIFRTTELFFWLSIKPPIPERYENALTPRYRVDFHKQCHKWADFTRTLVQGLSIDKQIYLRIKQQKNFKSSNIPRWNASLARNLAENKHGIKKYTEKYGIPEKSFIEKVLRRHEVKY